MDSVAERVNTSCAGVGAPMKRATRSRAPLVGRRRLLRERIETAMDRPLARS